MESQDEKTLIKKKVRRVRCGVELSVKEFNQGSGPSGERAGQERKNTIHKKRERGRERGKKKEKKRVSPKRITQRTRPIRPNNNR